MQNNKEWLQPKSSFELLENQGIFEEKKKIIHLVRETLPLVYWESRNVADNVWKIPLNLVKAPREGQIIVENREWFGQCFGEEYMNILGFYTQDKKRRDRIGINLDVFNEMTLDLKRKANNLQLNRQFDYELFVAFFILSHEGIAHNWCLENGIVDKKLECLLKELARDHTADIEEPFTDVGWDNVYITTHGCSLVFRKPDGEKILQIGNEINETFAMFLTVDIVYSFFKSYYWLKKEELDELLVMLSLIPHKDVSVDDMENVNVLRKEIGKSQLAKVYFGGEFYSDIFSRLSVEELTDLFVNLREGNSEAFVNAYLKNYPKEVLEST